MTLTMLWFLLLFSIQFNTYDFSGAALELTLSAVKRAVSWVVDTFNVFCSYQVDNFLVLVDIMNHERAGVLLLFRLILTIRSWSIKLTIFMINLSF